ncbi:hypothetical protein ABH940_003391 [Streptacidiphilus sp. BW17]|uniref:hypothetical protein n=1 Tax=Streptacidiphilus sp. BW17 TaxID=3156274 RepID=UPI00351275F6
MTSPNVAHNETRNACTTAASSAHRGLTGRAMTQGQLSYSGRVFDWTVIILTCGIWYPVYAGEELTP